MWAPDISRTAFILQPPLPITLLIAFAGTITFLDLRTTSFHPASGAGAPAGVFPVPDVGMAPVPEAFPDPALGAFFLAGPVKTNFIYYVFWIYLWLH